MKMNNIKTSISYEGWLKWASLFLLIAKGIEYLLYGKDLFSHSQLNTSILGIPLILCAVLLGFKRFQYKLIGARISFLILFLDNCDSFYQSSFLPHQFIEHTLMMVTPLLYLGGLKYGMSKINNFMRMAVALTFVGHGVFAVSWGAIPSHFAGMTNYILGLEGDSIKVFLMIMGLFDFLASFLLFTRKVQTPALLYMVVWGVLTSMARFIYGFESDVLRGLLGTLYRFPHFIVPLMLLMNYYSKRLSHSSSLP